MQFSYTVYLQPTEGPPSRRSLAVGDVIRCPGFRLGHFALLPKRGTDSIPPGRPDGSLQPRARCDRVDRHGPDADRLGRTPDAHADPGFEKGETQATGSGMNALRLIVGSSRSLESLLQSLEFIVGDEPDTVVGDHRRAPSDNFLRRQIGLFQGLDDNV